MERWYKENIALMIIAISLAVLFTFLYVYAILSKEKKEKNKYINVLYPKSEMNTFVNNKGVKKIKKDNKKLSQRISNYFKKKGITDKVSSLCVRAGLKKTLKDLVLDGVIFLILALAVFFALWFLINNPIIGGIIALFLVFFPYLNLYSKIRSREKEFRNNFPYFLQTVAFVLKNGTNFSQAFYEVTNKQRDGVLKEVMLNVLTIQNINAGDYKLAFKSIVTQVKIEEASEFVNVVLDNLEKGVSISDVFLAQAEGVNKKLELNRKRKISSASTKILLPILLLVGAIGIMFLQMFGV